MKHLKLFENFGEKDLDNLISGFEDLGIIDKKHLVFNFLWVDLSDYDKLKWRFYDDVELRVPISKYEKDDLIPRRHFENFPTTQFSKTLQDSVLANIKAGKIQLSGSYETQFIEDCFDPHELGLVAQNCQTILEFWDQIDTNLLKANQDLLEYEFGTDDMEHVFRDLEVIWSKNTPKFWVE